MGKLNGKITESDVIESYSHLHDIARVAKELGIARYRTREILLKNGMFAPPNKSAVVNEQEVRDCYLSGVSVENIAVKFKISVNRARKILKGITRQRPWNEDIVNDIVNSWKSGESQTSIGKRLGICQANVSRYLRKHGYCAPGSATKERHGMWKGGRSKINGYVRMLMDFSHPFFKEMADRDNYTLEHRLIMAEHLGRPLTSSEQVHHINGQKDDNRIENLQLRQGIHGTGVVRCCAECGSYNIIEEKLA